MSALQPIGPRWGSNQRGTAGASADLTVSGKTKQIRVINRDPTGYVFVRTWNSDLTGGTSPNAAATDFEVPPTFIDVFTKPEDDDRISVFSPTSALYSIMEGEGW